MNQGYIQVKAGINPLDYLGDGYVVMDYKYVLEAPHLSTYHRDVTSSKTVFNTEYPTYTYLMYNYDGSFLSVCPESHRQWMCDFPITLRGNKGDGILFDCDLVHGGISAPPGVERIATQYKLVHFEDLHLLTHLEGVDVCKKGRTIALYKEICMRITSYIFVVPIQWFSHHLLHREYFEGVFGFLQKLIPVNHYNNYKRD